MHVFFRRVLPLVLLGALALGSCVTHRRGGGPPPPPRHERDGRPGPPPGPYRN